MAAFEVFSGVQPYQEQTSPSLPSSPSATSNPFDSTLVRLRSATSTRSNTSPTIDHTSPLSQHLIISPDPSSPPPAWKRRPSQVVHRTRTNSTRVEGRAGGGGGGGGNTSPDDRFRGGFASTSTTSQPVSPPSASVIARSVSLSSQPPISPTRRPHLGHYPSAGLRMTSSAESGVDSSDAGTHLITPITSTERDDADDNFIPPQPMFGRTTPGSSTTSLRSLSAGDPYSTGKHSAAYSIPINDGPTELPDMSNPFRQADERPLDTVRRMTRLVERDAKRNSYIAQQHYIGAKEKGHIHPMTMSGNDMIWPTVPTTATPLQPIITGDAPAKRSKSTHSLVSLSTRKPSRHFPKSTPASPVLPKRQIHDSRSPSSTFSSSKFSSKASTTNGSAFNLDTSYPSARDFMLSLVPREGGYAVAAGFGGSAFPTQTQTFNGNARSERSSTESRTGMNEFGRMMTPQGGKTVGRMSMDAALFDYNAHGYRQPPPSTGAPLKSTHSGTSDSNSTSTSYIEESLGSNSSMPSPVIQPPVAEILTPVSARPSPLSQAVHISDSNDNSNAIGPLDDDGLTMRRSNSNMPTRQDSAALRSSPTQSSPLAAPPVTDQDVAAINAINVSISNKSKKLLEKEERNRIAALVKKRVDEEKDQRRQAKLRMEEARRKEKVDKEMAKTKAQQQKKAAKAAKQEEEDRIKAIRRKPPQTISASPAPISPAAPSVGANTPTTATAEVSPNSPSAQSSGSTVRGPPAEGPQQRLQPTLGRRASLVAMLGRSKDPITPPRPAASVPASISRVRQTTTSVARDASPTTSSVNSTLAKRKSSVWSALRKRLTIKTAPPPPVPQPANPSAVVSTGIRPTEYSRTTSSTGQSTADTRPMVTEAPILLAAPVNDPYTALAPRDDRGPPSSFSFDESTFNLARMTSLPSSETAFSTTSHDVTRERSRDSRDRQSFGQDRSRPSFSQRSTNASVHTLHGDSSGQLSRPISNVDKTLPPLPTDGQS